MSDPEQVSIDIFGFKPPPYFLRPCEQNERNIILHETACAGQTRQPRTNYDDVVVFRRHGTTP